MINSTSFIHFYIAPLLILLSLIKISTTPFRKDLLFSAFNLSVGILGLWEMAQKIVESPYFQSIESIFMGLTAGLFFSIALRDNSLVHNPKKNRVLAKIPLLGSMAFLTLHNFLSAQSYKIAFLLVFIGALGLYFKRNIRNLYFQAMFVAFFTGLIAHHFKMDEIFKSSAILVGLILVAFKYPLLEKKND